MIKYYKELDRPNDFYFTLFNRHYKGYHSFTPPLSFWEEHYELFNIIKEINYLIEYIKDDVSKIGCVPFDMSERDDYYWAVMRLQEMIKEDYCLNNPSILLVKEKKESIVDNDGYMSIPSVLDIPWDYGEKIKKEFDYVPIVQIIKFYIDFLSYLSTLNSEIYKNYKEQHKYLKKIKEDFSKYQIEYYREKYDKIEFPNCWLITPYGDLYNTTGKDGHKGANLIYNYSDTRSEFQTITEKIEPAKNKKTSENKIIISREDRRLEIKNGGYITITEFRDYLNLVDTPISIETPNDDFTDVFQRNFFRKIYHPQIVKIVLGIVSAEIAFDQFYYNLSRYTNNPSLEFEKIHEMTRGRIEEICVRCAGFHKIETNLEKTITTSSVDNLYMFEEYLKRGWNISVIPPIIINKEKGIVEELDFSSPYIERYVEKNIEPYKDTDVPGRGKVYCRHLGYGKL